MPFVLKFCGKYIRNRDRIRLITQFFELARHQPPRQPDANHLTNDDPVSLRADRVTHTRQAEQQPTTFARRIGAKRHYPIRQFLARQIEARKRVRFASTPDCQCRQDAEINNEDRDSCGHWRNLF